MSEKHPWVDHPVFKSLKNDFHKEILKRRPYQTVAPYTCWKYLTELMGFYQAVDLISRGLLDPLDSNLESFDFVQQIKDFFMSNGASAHLATHIDIWLGANAPVYVVRKDVLRMLSRTDLSTSVDNCIFKGLEIPRHPIMFLFPRHGLKSPEGNDCGFAFWHNARKGDRFSNFLVPEIVRTVGSDEWPIENVIFSSVYDDNGVIWASSFGVDADGSLLRSAESTQNDASVFDSIDSLMVQLVMLIMTQPSSVYQAPKSVRGNGFGRTSKKVSEIWHPRILDIPKDENFDPSFLTRRDARERGTHARPREHWRRGHWRNQPVGREGKERKLVWVRPSLINPSTEVTRSGSN